MIDIEMIRKCAEDMPPDFDPLTSDSDCWMLLDSLSSVEIHVMSAYLTSLAEAKGYAAHLTWFLLLEPEERRNVMCVGFLRVNGVEV